MQEIKNYIGGKFMPAVSGLYLDNVNPATGKVYSKIPDSDKRDVDLAVIAAGDAFQKWSKWPAEQRSKVLLRIAEEIEKNADRLALAESIDNGKPLKLAAAIDIPRAASNFQFYATGILHDSTHAYFTEGKAVNYAIRQPIGIAGCISPWNLPLYLFTWKIAPALASGCTVVAKPSEITPMTAYLLSELCEAAGLPPGVLNIVHGLGSKVGEAIVSHPQIPVLSFTGGTQTGAQISSIAAPKFKKMSLELGGKNPNLIFSDCNYEKMLQTTLLSSFSNQGQICLCGSRIFIEHDLYDQFRKDFVEATNKLKVGAPLAPETKIGAVVSQSHLEKIQGYLKLALEEGGKILCGGQRVILDGEFKDGFYLQPTVIENLAYDCRTNQEEIFGPVVTITPFQDEKEVLAWANSTQYGLSATIWTQNLERAHRVAHHLEAGIVWINCWLQRDLRTPFGGVKSSGLGREGGFEAIEFFTEQKNICVQLN